MTHPRALQLAPPDADRARLTAREAELVDREGDLARLKVELQDLQGRYLREIGGYYATLGTLEGAVFEAEVQAGIRLPMQPDPAADDTDEGHDGDHASCGHRSAPSDDLKRVFRDVAKAIHPDLALDESARYRRHSLMAEANRAYADRDADRLRLIMRAWEGHAEAIVGEGPEVDRQRVQRRLAEIDDRLAAIQAELADLRVSAIWRLKHRIDEARQQGWDLLAEMILQVKAEIARATARLASLRLATETSAPAAVARRV